MGLSCGFGNASRYAAAALICVAADAYAVECRSIDDWAGASIQVGPPAAQAGANPATQPGSTRNPSPSPGASSSSLSSVTPEQVRIFLLSRNRLGEVALLYPAVIICESAIITARALGRGPNLPQSGVVMFTTAIVELIGTNENRAASVLAHEIAHIIEAHGEQRARFSRLAARKASEIGAATEMQQRGIGTVVARQVFAEASAAYSRDIERRADEVGYQIYRAAGYDPREATKMFEVLQGIVGGREASYLDTHPGLEERIANIMTLAHSDVARVQVIDDAKVIAAESERYGAAAEAHIASGRWRELADLVAAWQNTLPKSGLGWYYRGILAQRSAKGKARAWELFAKAAQLDPERPEIWESLVGSLLDSGYRREAVACLLAMTEFGLSVRELRTRLFDDKVFVHGGQWSPSANLQWGITSDGRRMITNDPTIFSNQGIEGRTAPAWMPTR